MAAGIAIDCALYYNTGTFGSPTWVEITSVQNVQVGASWEAGDGSTRATRVKKEGRTQLPLQLSFNILADGGTPYVALRTAWLAAGTTALVDFMCLNGASDVNGSDGVRFEGEIHDFSRNEDIGGVVYRDVVTKPSVFSTNAVQSVLVTSGAPVFTTIA